MTTGGTGRMAVSVVVLALLAGLVWRTMEPGKYQQLTWLLLGFFAVRVLLGWVHSRRISSRTARDTDERSDV